jgi:hypothetical protein
MTIPFLTARVAGQQRHSSRHSLTFRPVGKGMPRRCTRCSATDSAAAGGGEGGVLGSDGAAATRVRWAVAGLSFRFGAESLRVVVSLADEGWTADRLGRLSPFIWEVSTVRLGFLAAERASVPVVSAPTPPVGGEAVFSASREALCCAASGKAGVMILSGSGR